MKNTTKGVFIIESVLEKHEKNDKYYEGKILKRILFLSSVICTYRIVKNKMEFSDALKDFHSSNFRYLHIACHGTREYLQLNKGQIHYKELGELLRPYTNYRRVFFSACKIVNKKLATELYKHKGKCFSLIGPGSSIYMDDSAICYSMFYVVAFKNNLVKRKDVIKYFSSICSLINIKLNYFSSSKSKTAGFKYMHLK